MKKLKTALFASTLLTAMFMYNSLEAFDGDNRWDVRICIERYPDGTGGIGSGCVYPDNSGPCSRTAGCMNVVIQE